MKKNLGFGRYGDMQIENVPVAYLAWVVSKAALRVTRPDAVLVALEEIQRRPWQEAKDEILQHPQRLILEHMKPVDDFCELV